MRTRFTGVGTALITPFRKDGSVDEPAVKRLARRQIDGGVHFLVPCGTTGESPTLTDGEKLRVCELVVEESNGAVPVVPHGTRKCTPASIWRRARRFTAGSSTVPSLRNGVINAVPTPVKRVRMVSSPKRESRV